MWSYNYNYLCHSNDTYLSHHGILGQKWGIRRFQNPDGSLTPAGKIRYRVNKNGELEERTKKEIKDIKKYGREIGRQDTSIKYADYEMRKALNNFDIPKFKTSSIYKQLIEASKNETLKEINEKYNKQEINEILENLKNTKAYNYYAKQMKAYDKQIDNLKEKMAKKHNGSILEAEYDPSSKAYYFVKRKL